MVTGYTEVTLNGTVSLNILNISKKKIPGTYKQRISETKAGIKTWPYLQDY